MIKIHKSKNGQYYFTVHAKNGAVLVTSEMYTRKSNMEKGIDALTSVTGRIATDRRIWRNNKKTEQHLKAMGF